MSPRQAAASAREDQEDDKSENAVSVAPINADEADATINQPQQHTNQATDVVDDKEVDEKLREAPDDGSLILELAEYMMTQSSEWWIEQFAYFNKMMYQNDAVVLFMWNDTFNLGYQPSQVLNKSSEIIDVYAQAVAKLNQTTTICDLVAKFIMMSIVGGENYEALQAEYETNFNPQPEQSEQSSSDDNFIESNSWTRGYAVGQHQAFESHIQQWLEQDTYGVIQVKFNGDHGPHTFVVERLGTGKFHMVQAYEGGLRLDEFMNNEFLESKTQPKKQQANEFGQGKSLDKSKLEKLMSYFVTALSTGQKDDGIPADVYLQAFGAYYDEKGTAVDNIALLAFNVAGSQHDINYKSKKGYLETSTKTDV